jgi:hypothetical protein
VITTTGKPRTIHLRDNEVRAALAGELTQVRRRIRPQPEPMPENLERILPAAWAAGFIDVKCPFGPSGTVLIGKEAWRTAAELDGKSPQDIAAAALAAHYPEPWAPVVYEADGARDNWAFGVPGKLRSAVHMPSWAARIRLVNRGVRVERGESGWEWVVDVEVKS